MKQFQFEYTNESELKKQLTRIRQWCSLRITSSVFFQIFSESLDTDRIKAIGSIIERDMPESFYIGCSTNGNIYNGVISDVPVIICCTICEYPSTNAFCVQLPLTDETEPDTIAEVCRIIDENKWIKAVEMLVTIRGMSMTSFCDDLEKIPEAIQIFGGGAFSNDINNNDAIVFSSGHEPSKKAVVFLFLGGDDLFIRSFHITGWKPLGKELLITRARSNIIYEIDGKPAYDTYYKYLRIKNDKDFFYNTLEFPFFYEHQGMNILRAPTACNDDGSIVMTADIEENVKAHLAYGDPWTILESVKEGARNTAEFSPEIIMLFSCAARKTFWGLSEVDKETVPFRDITSTSGLYTSGEFLRTGKYVYQHNVTLVVAAIREGENTHETFYNDDGTDDFTGKVSMISRLATFIDASTEDLKEANRQLSVLAMTDKLTGLLNRGEIQKRISDSIDEMAAGTGPQVFLIMLDVDDFKKVNDRYGHKEGDNVLKALSALIMKIQTEECSEGSSGRWGGEEFMVLLKNVDMDKAADIAERIRKDFSGISFDLAGHQTISAGVTPARKNETSDELCSRVDSDLYEAKKRGKDRVVSSL